MGYTILLEHQKAHISNKLKRERYIQLPFSYWADSLTSIISRTVFRMLRINSGFLLDSLVMIVFRSHIASICGPGSSTFESSEHSMSMSSEKLGPCKWKNSNNTSTTSEGYEEYNRAIIFVILDIRLSDAASEKIVHQDLPQPLFLLLSI